MQKSEQNQRQQLGKRCKHCVAGAGDDIKEANWSQVAINSHLTLVAGPEDARVCCSSCIDFHGGTRGLIFSIMFMTLMYTQSDAPRHVFSAAPSHKFPSASSISRRQNSIGLQRPQNTSLNQNQIPSLLGSLFISSRLELQNCPAHPAEVIKSSRDELRQ